MTEDALALDAPRWSELRHGDGGDIPGLLRQLDSTHGDGVDDEPWFTLWSALAHQGDVYSASFAAAPHVIYAISRRGAKVTANFFQLPAWIEICRVRNATQIPEDLAGPYFAALDRLPHLAAEAAVAPWDRSLLSCVLAAVAASKGDTEMAEGILDSAKAVRRLPRVAQQPIKDGPAGEHVDESAIVGVSTCAVHN